MSSAYLIRGHMGPPHAPFSTTQKHDNFVLKFEILIIFVPSELIRRRHLSSQGVLSARGQAVDIRFDSESSNEASELQAGKLKVATYRLSVNHATELLHGSTFHFWK